MNTNNGNSSKITINLNGNDVDVPQGINLVEAASLHGIEVFYYCYHPKLSVAGNCRMCSVEMGTPMRDRASGEPILDDSGTQKNRMDSKCLLSAVVQMFLLVCMLELNLLW